VTGNLNFDALDKKLQIQRLQENDEEFLEISDAKGRRGACV
jgi:hypothetical protein